MAQPPQFHWPCLPIPRPKRTGLSGSTQGHTFTEPPPLESHSSENVFPWCKFRFHLDLRASGETVDDMHRALPQGTGGAGTLGIGRGCTRVCGGLCLGEGGGPGALPETRVQFTHRLFTEDQELLSMTGISKVQEKSLLAQLKAAVMGAPGVGMVPPTSELLPHLHQAAGSAFPLLPSHFLAFPGAPLPPTGSCCLLPRMRAPRTCRANDAGRAQATAAAGTMAPTFGRCQPAKAPDSPMP